MSNIYKFELDEGYRPINEMTEVLDNVYDAVRYACGWLDRRENDAWNGKVYTVHISRKDKWGNFEYYDVVHKHNGKYYLGAGIDKPINPKTGRPIAKKKDTQMHPFGL